MKIVITGGIGSGKSLVTRLLGQSLPSFHVISVDNIVRELYERRDIQRDLHQAFGVSDRQTISELVFHDKHAMRQLVAIFDRALTETLNRVMEVHRDIIVEFPLYFEYGMGDYVFDMVVSVVAPEALREARVLARDNITTEKFQKVLANQVTDEVRENLSDEIVDNDGDITALESRVVALHDSIIREQINRGEVRTGVVSGSFDPITLGHKWVIQRALEIVDVVVVTVSHNPAKNYLFDVDTRRRLVIETLRDLSLEQQSRVIVEVLPPKALLVEYAAELGAKFIIRGIRNFNDFGYEMEINLVQRKIAPQIETIYLLPPSDLTEVSSSLVKAMIRLDGWEKVVKPYVSPAVLCELKLKSR